MDDIIKILLVLALLGVCFYNVLFGSTTQKAIYGMIMGTTLLIMLLNVRSYYVEEY